MRRTECASFARFRLAEQLLEHVGGPGAGSGRAEPPFHLVLDELRVAVTSDGVNLHTAGREEQPLLCGQLGGNIDPARCSWQIRPGQQHGTIKVDIVELILAKERKGAWNDLFKVYYT